MIHKSILVRERRGGRGGGGEEQQEEEEEEEGSVTELCLIPEDVKSGYYVCDLQISPMHMDAVPSRPVLYRIFNVRCDDV